MSCETQESISSSSVQSQMGEPASKKQKINASSECAITGIKVTNETSVQIGKEKIWAPALLLFSKYFDAIGSHSIHSYLTEAQEKIKHSKVEESPFTAFVLSESAASAEKSSDQSEVREQSGMDELNIQRFWLVYLEVLETKLLEHVKLDAGVCHSNEICRLIYNLTMLLHTMIPVEGLASLNRLCKTVDTVLMGETFWEYNPILLTQVHIWAHELLDSVFKDHSASAKKHHIALSFALAQAQHPCPAIKVLTEAQVCDQQLAIRLARNELDEFDEDAGWGSYGNVTYGTTAYTYLPYNYTSGFTNGIQQSGNIIAAPNFYIGIANW